jgi:hypothetical protein
MTWPPHVDELEKPEEPNDLLLKFLTWLKHPTMCHFDESFQDPVICALASLLLSYITGKHSPLKVELSIMLHGLTRSREIIDILSKFSLGITYKDVLKLYDSWAKHDIEQNDICPGELAEGVPGTGILDHDDFRDDTLTGADTSHRTNVMFMQPEDIEIEGTESNQQASVVNPQDFKRLCTDQHKVDPYKTVQRGLPAVRQEIDITPSDTQQQKQRGVIHSLVRLDKDVRPVPAELQKIGAFGGFQASVQKKVVKSKPYYFLTFPQPPSKSVIHEVMHRMVAAAKKKLMPFIQLVGDQPVYALIVELKAENPEAFKLILPFLGPFHAHCSFMYAIYKRFSGSGLSDILVAANIIAAGSVDQALHGKHYKRGIRCLRLMHEALTRRIIKKGIQDGASLSENVKSQIAKLQDPLSTPEERKNIYAALESDLEVVRFFEEVFEGV